MTKTPSTRLGGDIACRITCGHFSEISLLKCVRCLTVRFLIAPVVPIHNCSRVLENDWEGLARATIASLSVQLWRYPLRSRHSACMATCSLLCCIPAQCVSERARLVACCAGMLTSRCLLGRLPHLLIVCHVRELCKFAFLQRILLARAHLACGAVRVTG